MSTSSNTASEIAFLARAMKAPRIPTAAKTFAAKAAEEPTAVQARVKAARFPPARPSTTSTSTFQRSMKTATSSPTSASSTSSTKPDNVVFLGPPGTGKTHLAIGLGVRACQAGHRVAFATAAEWVDRLAAAHHTGRAPRRARRLGRYPAAHRRRGRLHPLRSRRRQPVLPAHLSPLRTRLDDRHLQQAFGRWGEVFGDPVVAAAMIDRLVHHAEVVSLKGDSYRLVEKYRELGSYRAAARACGVDHKTVKAVVDRVARGQAGVPRRPVVRERNYDSVADVVRRRVEATQGRITAKRLLPLARAEGYDGSDRNFRRLVADAKADYRRHGGSSGRGVPGRASSSRSTTGCGLGGMCSARCWCGRGSGSCASPATSSRPRRWSCWRSASRRSAGCRRWCWRTGSRACAARSSPTGSWPTPAYVRFAAHYGFRPDWCETADPQSKGVVENLVGYAKTDLVIPSCDGWRSLGQANAAARDWCDEVNSVKHSEIAAVPADRLAEEVKVLRGLPSLRAAIQRGEARKVDRLATVRFGSARYSVPARLVGAQVWVSVAGDHVLIDHGEQRVAEHPLIAPARSPSSTRITAANAAPPGVRCVRAPPPRRRSSLSGRSPNPSYGPPPRPVRPVCRPTWATSSGWRPPTAATGSSPRSSGR
jgi:hypothetical protein